MATAGAWELNPTPEGGGDPPAGWGRGTLEDRLPRGQESLRAPLPHASHGPPPRSGEDCDRAARDPGVSTMTMQDRCHLIPCGEDGFPSAPDAPPIPDDLAAICRASADHTRQVGYAPPW